MNTFINVLLVIFLGFMLLFFLFKIIKKIKVFFDSNAGNNVRSHSNHSALAEISKKTLIIRPVDLEQNSIKTGTIYYFFNNYEKAYTYQIVSNRKRDVIEMK